MKFTVMLCVGLAGLAITSSAAAGDKCNAKAERPTKSVAWDPFDLGMKPSAYKLWDQKLCRYKSVFKGRAKVANLRAQMTKAQFRHCIKLTKDGKRPARKEVRYIKTNAERV